MESISCGCFWLDGWDNVFEQKMDRNLKETRDISRLLDILAQDMGLRVAVQRLINKAKNRNSEEIFQKLEQILPKHLLNASFYRLRKEYCS